MLSKEKKIIAEQTGRLDVALGSLLNITRSQAQKLIEQGRVLVNEKRPKKTGQQVKEGDQLVISSGVTKGRSREISIVPDSSAPPRLRSGSVGMTIEKPKTIAETSDYVVIEKPTGLLTHPTMAEEKNTLVDFLVKKYPEIKNVGDQYVPTERPTRRVSHPPTPLKGGLTYRHGIVHRLDKEASGLLVAARTQKMFNHLKEQFKNRTIGKEYYALVHGKVAKDWDIITFPIARGKTHERMAARPVTGRESIGVGTGRDLSLQQREAKTEFLVERRFVNFTLLRVTLHTGRMHQIRVHLLAYNHPLVGDPLYFQKKRKRAWDERLGRLFLHATKLSFTDLEGQRQAFESPLPEELEEFLKSLK